MNFSAMYVLRALSSTRVLYALMRTPELRSLKVLFLQIRNIAVIACIV